MTAPGGTNRLSLRCAPLGQVWFTHVVDTVMQVKIAMAGVQDAFAVGALHLQHDRASGSRVEPGFLDRFADSWLAQRSMRPTWLAISSDGDPLAVLSGLMVPDLPRLGPRRRAWLQLGLLYVVPAQRRSPLASRLLSQAQHWCLQQDVAGIQVDVASATHALYADHGFAAATDLLQWRPGR